MPRIRSALALTAAAALLLTGCAGGSTAPGSDAAAASSDAFPVTITHALGTTEIPAQPARVATISWGNQDVALALGIVPVGMDSQTWAWSGTATPGVYAWTTEKLTELGADTPTLFDVTDGIDFEAISDTQPDVILAA